MLMENYKKEGIKEESQREEVEKAAELIAELFVATIDSKCFKKNKRKKDSNSNELKKT